MGISTTHLGGIGFHFIKEAGVFPPGRRGERGRVGRRRRQCCPAFKLPNLWAPSRYSFRCRWGPQVMGRHLDYSQSHANCPYPGLGSPGSPHPWPGLRGEPRPGFWAILESKVMLTSESCASGFRLLLAPLPGTNGFQISPFSPTDNAAWLLLTQCILLPLASAGALSPPEPLPPGSSPPPRQAGRSEIAEESAFPQEGPVHASTRCHGPPRPVRAW